MLALAFGGFFLLIMFAITFFDRNPSRSALFIYRILLAIVAAGLGGVIPGIIHMNIQLVIRVAAAIAVFGVVFWSNPSNVIAGEEL